ncbi:MAG: RtcB family protein [Selenomonadaceae bacterium]|nr:RtcB family protein [Selenomonadaceae bacterium]
MDQENKILRKGAISSYADEEVLIPMNMRDGSLTCVGKGNEDRNYSAPHGAGRIMSRAAAKELISLEDFQQSMDGIFSTSISEGTIDESPMVYKPAAEIENLIAPTVEVREHLKPLYNF